MIDLTCQRCRLAGTRKHIVPHGGASIAQIIGIGDGPGVSDDMLGKAFTGGQGSFLDTLFRYAGITEPVLLTNIVLCRPCDSIGGETREVMKDEVAACMPNVSRIINALHPKGIIFIGSIAQRYYRRLEKEFTTCHIIHPTAILKTGGLRSPYFLECVTSLERFRHELYGE